MKKTNLIFTSLTLLAIFLGLVFTPTATLADPPAGTICTVASFACKARPTLLVDFTATPPSGFAHFTPKLSATVSGTATGTINYTLYCNQNDPSTAVVAGYAEKIDNSTANPYTSTACTYTTPGTYTAKVIVQRDYALPVAILTTITVPDRPSLLVQFNASPSTGLTPFNPTLTAIVSGAATGAINYTVYCNQSNTGTTVTPGYASKKDATLDNPYTTTACTYSTPGTYTAKVIIERSSALPIQAQTTITVTARPTLSASLTITPTTGTPVFQPQVTVDVTGTASGASTFTFYCDGPVATTTVTQDTVPYTGTPCTYTNPGTYTLKVQVQRGTAFPTTATGQVIVTGPPIKNQIGNPDSPFNFSVGSVEY